MKQWWWVYVLLLGLALAAGLGAGASVTDSPIPSANNPGPHGLKVLRVWLEQTGHKVPLLDSSLETLPPGLSTLVLAAPQGHAVSIAELASLEAFVRDGGTLVYLVPRHTHVQQDLDEWLGVHSGLAPSRSVTDAHPDDLLGVTDEVTVAGGALKKAKALRFVIDDSLTLDADDAVPVTAQNMLWYKKLGDGEIWVGAGPDLAESARLELDDNLAFWSALASRGPLAFDEFHQAPRPTPALSANLWGSLGQLLFCALVFALAFGARLGPARPTPQERHRSSLEYVTAMAALAREGCAESELAAEQVERLRRLELLPEDAGLDPSRVRGPADFLAFSRRAAEVEARARGVLRG
jgi:hypothetical protein